MNLNKHILDLADQCVKCGMCLPHCPTYLSSQLESESPRGRIAIMQGLVTNKIRHTQAALTHIDNCLTCRACEKICPSEVQYGTLLDQFKLHQKGKLATPLNRFRKSLIRFVLLNPVFNSKILPCLLKLVKLFRFEKKLGINNRRVVAYGSGYQTGKDFYPAQNTINLKNSSVGIFVGCTGSSFDQDTLSDIIFVLNTIGYNVRLAPVAHCCGALDSHAGLQQSALQRAVNNINSFKQMDIDRVLYFATGCGAQLTEYHQLDWSSSQQREAAQQFVDKLAEVSHFIHRNWPTNITFKTVNQTVAVHEPCTHRNVLRQSDIGGLLLSRISGIKIIPLPENKLCCGAAGDYMLTHKNMANTLRAAKLKEFRLLQPDIILTTNIGCAMHLRNGLYAENQLIPVLHPVSLIAELLVQT